MGWESYPNRTERMLAEQTCMGCIVTMIFTIIFSIQIQSKIVVLFFFFVQRFCQEQPSDEPQQLVYCTCHGVNYIKYTIRCNLLSMEPPAPVRFLSQWPLARVPHQSRLSASDEMIPKVVNRSLTFTLRLNKTNENLCQDPVDEGHATSHCLKWGPSPPNEVRSYGTSGQEKEEKKGKTIYIGRISGLA